MCTHISDETSSFWTDSATGKYSTDRADAGDVAAAEKAEVEERQEEQADSDMAQLQFRPGDHLVPVLRLVRVADVAF